MSLAMRKLCSFLFLLSTVSAHATLVYQHPAAAFNPEANKAFSKMQRVVETNGTGQMKQSVGYTKHTCGIKREACKQKDKQKKTVGEKGKMDLWLKLFIASLAVLAASLVVTVFEFSFLAVAALLAVIGWVVFGIGIVLAVLALVFAIVQLVIICRIGVGINDAFSF
jgi:hypothetical protein